MSDRCYDLRDRRALVTGGASGIGKATARMLAENGALVAVLGKGLPGVEETVEALGGRGKGHVALQSDVSDADQMKAAFTSLSQAWSRLDILVINAGINGVWCPLEDLAPAEWDKTMAVNLRGTFLTLKFALPMLRPGGGSVIVVSSINGTRIFNTFGATAYACSKAAQVAFVKMAALELAPDRIRVNAVCPGAINTNIERSTTTRKLDQIALPAKVPHVPLTGGPPVGPEEAARLILYLASDFSSHVSGTEIYLDGAQSLLAT